MREPDNHTAWIDYHGDTWVRVDDTPGRYGSWWPLCDGPNWDPRQHHHVGQSRTWDDVEEYGPFAVADPDRTARALDAVRQEAAR